MVVVMWFVGKRKKKKNFRDYFGLCIMLGILCVLFYVIFINFNKVYVINLFLDENINICIVGVICL